MLSYAPSGNTGLGGLFGTQEIRDALTAFRQALNQYVRGEQTDDSASKYFETARTALVEFASDQAHTLSFSQMYDYVKVVKFLNASMAQ